MVVPVRKSLKREGKKGLMPRKTAMKPESMSMQIEDEAPDFPRGGGSMLSRQEWAEARADAEAEFEAEEKGPKKRKRPKREFAEDDDYGVLFGGSISSRLPKLANKITLKNVSAGMKLWGVIVEVNSKDLAIGLPGGLRGFVHIEEASDIFFENGIKDPESNFLCSIFHVGQLVSCVVLQVDDIKQNQGGKKIWVSLRLALLHKALTLESVTDGMVLTAYVKSIEDYGYILHFGSSSFSGFVPRNVKEDNGKTKMHVGQLIRGVVKSIDKARGIVHLNHDPDFVANSVIKDLKGLSIDLLLPGMMVTARVHGTINNGIMLSFLTYFTGTVDIFHLQNAFPNSMWKDSYSENKRVSARILFIDPSTRAIGLTMNSYLLRNKAPPCLVKTGEIFDTSRVVRVDKGFGLLLEIPSSPVPSPAFVGMHDVSDEEVRKLAKRFPEGSSVRLRILGFKHLEGIAIGTLKTSAFEGSVFTHSDVKPGMHVKAKIISLDGKGALVELYNGVKALCPVSHMSEFEFPKPSKKFKVGAQLLFRVLGCKSKRITVTHKKTLVRSKLEILASYTDVREGLITHGWISKVENFRCFVRFYNGVTGIAYRTELGLDPGSDPSSMFHTGQVVKCRVISVSSRKISLSFITSSKGSECPKLGSLVSGVVERFTPSAVIICVNLDGYKKGAIYNEHLADNEDQSKMMRTLLKPGYEFDQLLVLDVEGGNFILSAKYSLINSANELPQEVMQVHSHSVIHGYICNIIETGCFVRFLGRLTGFAPKHKVTDDQKTDISEAFYVGQSVRSRVLNIDCDQDRIKLSLNQSSCFSTDASFIQGCFLLEDKIARLKESDSSSSGLECVQKFNIGSLVDGEVREVKDSGVTVSFKDHAGVVGFITNDQMNGKKLERGSIIRGLVLDVSMSDYSSHNNEPDLISKLDHVVDLSLKPELIRTVKEGKNDPSSEKKRKRGGKGALDVHQSVNSIVEIAKKNYLVLSLPDYDHAIGYASIYDYNTQKLPHRHFTNGQSVIATVEALPSPLTAGRLLLVLKSLSELKASSSSKRAKKKSSYNVGSLIQAEIIDIKPMELRVIFGIGLHGRVHITEVTDDFVERPFETFKVGQQLSARIITATQDLNKSNRRSGWELSLKPSVLAEPMETAGDHVDDSFNYAIGEVVKAYVTKLDKEWVWLTVSRSVRAELFLLDTSCEPSELQEFQKKFCLGQIVSGAIIGTNQEKRLLRITLRCSSVGHYRPQEDNPVEVDSPRGKVSNNEIRLTFHKGDIVGGRISKILPGVGGLLVQIGPRLFGKVHFTELMDDWVPDPLKGYYEGQFVKCKVLDINPSFKGTTHVELSLRATSGGTQSDMVSINKRYEEIAELHPSMEVQGYVKNTTSKGCFIMLSWKIDAKILISNLSDNYIECFEEEFPIGMLVKGKVLSVEPLSKRVEVTLKKTNKSQKSKITSELRNLHIGEVLAGTIRRVESYGLFITIDQTNVVGLCHISELSDARIENIEDKYKVGERVAAKVLKVDEETQRVSLGMKNSYMEDGYALSNHESMQLLNGIVVDDDSGPTLLVNDAANAGETFPEQRTDRSLALAQVESRACVPPLSVNLDDLEGLETKNGTVETGGLIPEDNKNTNKNRRKQKKKEKEEREQEIRAAEERLKELHTKPETEDEYEKLVRSSPNNSFVWIQYMQFMLSLANVEKAQSIAERALRTINFREEGEKLNIWVAYLNLENEYGNPPEDAVTKIFHRALQFCDPKRIHLALLGLYETTQQLKLAEELLNRMVKRFKKSCKVWLRRVQGFLKQERDGIQTVVNQALLSLPRHKHIKFISHAAILEFKAGVPDRGRSLFEGILREYPKRTDLWIVYLDQEICLLNKNRELNEDGEVKQEDAEIIRALFERATCLSLPPKKMKSIFKKFLEFEKCYGDEERVEYVRKKALDFVEG